MELGDGEQGDRLDAGQVGYGEGQADYKTQDQDKDGMSKAREATLGMVCYGEGQAGSPRTTGEATLGVDNRKTSIRTKVSHTTTKLSSAPVSPAASSSVVPSAPRQTSVPTTPRPPVDSLDKPAHPKRVIMGSPRTRHY